MADLEELAHETDRLVWAVGDTLRARRDEMAVASTLEQSTFGPLVNLMPFRHHLTESMARRRYIYRPEAVMTSFLADLVESGLFTKDGDVLTPTDKAEALNDEVEAAADVVSRGFWESHEDTVHRVSPMARQVIDAARGRDGLIALAQEIDEPADPFHLLWQRLTGLRLVRNEAHVDAWRALDIGPHDVEVLTGAWAGAGTLLQAPVTYSDTLIDLGFVKDDAVTEAGLIARRQIEDTTNAGVEAAFSVIDSEAFTAELSTIPPWIPRG